MWLEKFEFDEFDGSGEIHKYHKSKCPFCGTRQCSYSLEGAFCSKMNHFKFAIFTSKRGRGINFEFQCSPAVLLGMLQI